MLIKNRSEIPICKIKYDVSPGNTHVSQIVAGYKLLEKNGFLKIKSAEPCFTFRSSGNYEHNSIVEVEINGKILAYDMADGYQSIHRFDVFDSQLDRLDFYFKRSCDLSKHIGMKNAKKIKPLGFNYLCSCKGNPYDNYIWRDYSIKSAKNYLVHQFNKKENIYDYKIFETNNIKYDDYKLLFLTRLWDSSGITVEGIKRTYPYFTDNEATLETEKWKQSLEFANKNRLEYVRVLRETYGERAIAGFSADFLSQKLCPELIISGELTERRKYLKEIKKNYICITSEGLHQSIGWKFAEYIAAGKAIVTEPLAYETTGYIENGKNYFVYNNTKELVEACDTLLNNIDLVHEMGKDNINYYNEHLRPDMIVLDSLKIVLNNK